MRDTDVLGAGDPGALEALLGRATEGGALQALAEAYRRFGWMAADLDPLGLLERRWSSDLDPAQYGLTADAAAPFRLAYCGTIGWEFGHVQDPTRRTWLADAAEQAWVAASDLQFRALDLIARGEVLEATFDRRMPGAKTFGLSGAEGYLVLLSHVLAEGASGGATHAIMGGMHRGRLTQMGLVFGKPLVRIIADAKGVPEYPESLGASSDSPYHLGWEGSIKTDGGALDVWVAPHPSHLSVVAPVGLGRARAAQDAGQSVLPLALHTDAAFAGQGVNAELLQMAGLPPFDVGGTIHLMLDNQVGFTTGAEEARTARTSADMAKVTETPVLHVNGGDPDACLRAAEVAVAYRRAFGSDILIRLIACRRKGHNEIDQPRFTQPGMYRAVDALPALSGRYAGRIGADPDLTAFRADLDAAFEAAKEWRPNTVPEAPGLAADIEEQMLAPVETGVDAPRLRALGQRLTQIPGGITPHTKVTDFLAARRTAVEKGDGVDWAMAEALAIASLLEDGHPVRLGGQDSVRGAFTQRHARVHCQDSRQNHLVFEGIGARADVFNTPLTENAVVGFEYGYSLGAPHTLSIWEAQFGDFLNVCQPMFDQFIVCGEDRWLLPSGLVMLLPHGVDGGGPDHATAHPERLLAACARGNMQVVNLSTPANYFHALRRQVKANWRKPLAVLAPKTLLRHPGAKSRLDDLSGQFKTVIAETRKAPRVVVSTGKLAVLLEAERDKRGLEVALIRLEQLYPLDGAALAAALEPYQGSDLIWAQEEPANMGYFGWLDRKLEAIAGRCWRLVSRPASPSASAGPKTWDDARLKTVIDEALEA